MPASNPNTMAPSEARIGPSGNPMSRLTANRESRKPARPANAACAIDTWPSSPVSTTNDNATSATAMLVMTPNR